MRIMFIMFGVLSNNFILVLFVYAAKLQTEKGGNELNWIYGFQACKLRPNSESGFSYAYKQSTPT